VVDPDVAGAIKGDGITAPDVLGVELADGDVLDDNVGNATSKTQALSEKHTLLSVTDDGLVALDLDRVERSLVVLDVNACSAGLVVGAPTT
jgi:aminoglycoside/choline kinase family phosphotransferase